MKRRQRAGLPIYPPEVHVEATAYHLQHRYLEHQPHSSASFALLLSSCYPKKLNDPSQSNNSNPNQLQNQPDSSNCYINPSQKHFKFSNENGGNSNLALPLSPLSPYGSSSSTLLNHSFGDHGFIAGSPYEPFPLVPGSTPDISSNQTPTPASSYASGVDGLMGSSSMVNNNSNNNNDYYEVAPLSPPGNSGLLDALVMEAQGLSHNDKSKNEEDPTLSGKLSCKRKNLEYAEEGCTPPMVSAMKKNSSNSTTTENQRDDDNSSSQWSKGETFSLFCLFRKFLSLISNKYIFDREMLVINIRTYTLFLN